MTLSNQERERERERESLMDQPELSLGPSSLFSESSESSSSVLDAGNCRKRKHTWVDEAISQTSKIELHLNHPLPLDWEQCLDLQSGMMYYQNRKTLKKSRMMPKLQELDKPKKQNLDLDLNISTLHNTEDIPVKLKSPQGSMVAVACFNCHLLVMLCRSNPSCPNCKFVNHLLPSSSSSSSSSHKISPRKMEPSKPLETLSLLH